MAARKKVTKKVSKPRGRGAANRSKRKSVRAQAREAKPTRAATKASAKESTAKVAAAKAVKDKIISAPTPKKGGAAAKSSASAKPDAKAKPTAEKAASAAVQKASAREETPKSPGVASELHRRSMKAAEPAARSEPASAAGSSATTTRAPEVAAKPTPSAAPAASAPQNAAKTAKPSPPTKVSDQEPSGGEQKTMKNSSHRHGFKLNEFVVYPAHGVGQIVAVEDQEVAGFRLELFVINFVKDKMTLRVPTSKVTGVGMRKLSDPEAARRSLEILTGRARVKRTMWSRRAQEYEAKINSGDINAIAEVVRDLYRSEAQPEQSYSERQLYEAALDRMMREIAAVQKLSETEALKLIDTQLRKNQKRAVKADAPEGDEAGIEEAA